MVGIGDMKRLKEAYPSYFLDTRRFLKFLSEFERKCRLLTGKE